MSTTNWRIASGMVAGCPVGTLVEVSDETDAWRIAKTGVLMVTLPKATTAARYLGDDLVLVNPNEGIEVQLSPEGDPGPALALIEEIATPDGGLLSCASLIAFFVLLGATFWADWWGGTIGHVAGCGIAGAPLVVISGIAIVVGGLIFRLIGWGWAEALGFAALAATLAVVLAYGWMTFLCSVHD